MMNTIVEYQLQIKKAKKTLKDLQRQLQDVETKLASDSQNTNHLRELQRICLDITITENELEHAQVRLATEHSTDLKKGNTSLSA